MWISQKLSSIHCLQKMFVSGSTYAVINLKKNLFEEYIEIISVLFSVFCLLQHQNISC